MENESQTQTNGGDYQAKSQIFNQDDLLAELESLRRSYGDLVSRSSMMEENLLRLQHERDNAITQYSDLKIATHEISCERDSIREQFRELEGSCKEKEDGFLRRIEEELSRKEEVEKEMEVSIENLEVDLKEAKRKNGLLLKTLDSLQSVKDCLVKILDCLDDEKEMVQANNDEIGSVEFELESESRAVWEEIMSITRLANEVESKVKELKEIKKEKTELERSVVSLTEENRDINSLLRVALVEKEAVEKSLNKLKGNSEQKRVALLQFAERGLQRVGFGFMMGSGSNEQSVENSGAAVTAISSNKSDSSECEEEPVSVASTVEKIMKNLRLEITQLRRSLAESRSDTERLQSLTKKQAEEISENTLYIKELEARERMLVQNVEELLTEIKETEIEVSRWREACELEVNAGKNEIEERDKVVKILKQELDKTKAALEISNCKLKMKEELVDAAMAAEAAAERSLQLADGRAAGLRERIEELTRQLEEVESRERRFRKLRHICWPWKMLKVNLSNRANAPVHNARRMLPEMQSLLHHSL